MRFDSAYRQFMEATSPTAAPVTAAEKATVQAPLVCVVGVSGVGKDTLIHEVEKLRPWVRKPVSVTTRPPRPGETDGVDYFFISDRDFDRKIAAGELFEWTAFDGHRYGSLFSQLSATDGIVRLCHRENEGAQALKERLGAYLVGILPPSWEAIADRLRRRGDQEEDIEARLVLDKARTAEIRGMSDTLIVNGDLVEATAQLVAVVDGLRVSRRPSSESFWRNGGARS